jgi:hypothetical protein
MAKILSFIMAIFTALYMFVSCGKIPGTGDNETTTVPAETVTEPLGEPVSETESEETSSQTQQQAGQDEKESDTEVPPVSKTLKLKISGREVPVTWESNESVAALSQLSSEGLSVNMSMYGGFEQVGSLGSSLPRNDRQTTTSYGDIVLYQGNQIVIFYGSNSWSYTRLGHINLSQSEMTQLLSDGDVDISLKYE